MGPHVDAQARILPALSHLAFPVDRLDPMPGNPRRGDVDAIARSLARFGQRRPLTARHTGDRGQVTAGNHTLIAARDRLGWTELAVAFTDDDDATAEAWALADNRTSDLGAYDQVDLAAMLANVRGFDPELLTAASYGESDLVELLAATGATGLTEGAFLDTMIGDAGIPRLAGHDAAVNGGVNLVLVFPDRDQRDEVTAYLRGRAVDGGTMADALLAMVRAAGDG